MVLALDGAAVLVDLGDGDLNRGVILRLDDAVGRRALPRDVAKQAGSVHRVAPEFNSNGSRTGRQFRRDRSPWLRCGMECVVVGEGVMGDVVGRLWSRVKFTDSILLTSPEFSIVVGVTQRPLVGRESGLVR